MSDIVIVGLLSLVGTLSGTFGGIMASSRLTTYRLKKLEEKVDAHNSLIDRMYKQEAHSCVVDERLDYLEQK